MKHKVLLKATKTPDEVCIYYADHASYNAINLCYTSDKDVYLENIIFTNYGVRNGWEFSLYPELVEAVVKGVGINWELILPNVTVIETDNSFEFHARYSDKNMKTRMEVRDAINNTKGDVNVDSIITKRENMIIIEITPKENAVDDIISIVDALILLEIQQKKIDNPVIDITEFRPGVLGPSLKMWTTHDIDTSRVKIDWKFSELESPTYRNNDLL